MATITRNMYNDRQQSGQHHAGNASTLHFKLETNSIGAVVGSDSTSAVADADVVRIGLLPGGLRLDDAVINIVTAWTASVDGKFGFQYADGVDVAATPEDDDYFATAVDMDSAAVSRKATALAPATLPKDAYLILTTDTADNAKASVTYIDIHGEFVGMV